MIFSDEPLVLPTFGQRVVVNGPGSQMGDFCGIGLCDYVIAPMSTFSSFAFFLTGTSVAWIDRDTRTVSKADFHPIKYFGSRPAGEIAQKSNVAIVTDV